MQNPLSWLIPSCSVYRQPDTIWRRRSVPSFDVAVVLLNHLQTDRTPSFFSKLQQDSSFCNLLHLYEPPECPLAGLSEVFASFVEKYLEIPVERIACVPQETSSHRLVVILEFCPENEAIGHFRVLVGRSHANRVQIQSCSIEGLLHAIQSFCQFLTGSVPREQGCEYYVMFHGKVGDEQRARPHILPFRFHSFFEASREFVSVGNLAKVIIRWTEDGHNVVSSYGSPSCTHLCARQFSDMRLSVIKHGQGFEEEEEECEGEDLTSLLPECVFGQRTPPTFLHRGFMLDVARSFFSIDFIKSLLELMALYGLNVFHWHLTDDQAWRFCVPEYQIHSFQHYTLEQIREVEEFANQRGIVVVPEIEMPAHSLAAIRATSNSGREYFCENQEMETIISDELAYPVVEGKRASWSKVGLCLHRGRDFVDDVLAHVALIFKSKLIHVGMDEMLKSRDRAPLFTGWLKCPQCGHRDEEAVHRSRMSFVDHVLQKVDELGLSPIAWDEILCEKPPKVIRGEFPREVCLPIIQCWRNGSSVRDARRIRTRGIVASWIGDAYFSSSPEAEEQEDGTKAGRRLFFSNPLHSGYTRDLKTQRKLENVPVLGMEAAFWSENIGPGTRFFVHLFPRMLVLAEKASRFWKIEEDRERPNLLEEEEQQWVEFQTRMDAHLRRMLSVLEGALLRQWLN